MSKLLKGNYEVAKGKTPAKTSDNGEDRNSPRAQEEFERRALERLGGSIAFVMKGKTFLWNGDNKDEDKA